MLEELRTSTTFNPKLAQDDDLAIRTNRVVSIASLADAGDEENAFWAAIAAVTEPIGASEIGAWSLN